MSEVDKEAIEELATEWMLYASRFGLIAEILNGRWTSEQVTDMARGVLALSTELRDLRNVTEDLHSLRNIVKRLRAKWPDDITSRGLNRFFDVRLVMTDEEIARLDRGIAALDAILGGPP